MNCELKIQEDAFDRGEALAAELRIKAPTALGHLLYLWRWAVRVLRPSPDAAPTGIVTGRATVQRIEAAARWDGKPGELVEALIALGLVTRVNKKMRVKGTEPYAREQRKKEKARERERKRRAERKLLLEQAGLKKPSIVRSQPSKEALAYWHWMMHERSTPEFGPGPDGIGQRIKRNGIVMDHEPPRNFAQWFEKLMGEKVSVDSLNGAWARYLLDKEFGPKGWPVAVFMHENVFRQRLTRRDEQHTA